jgi:hypothetical protein
MTAPGTHGFSGYCNTCAYLPTCPGLLARVPAGERPNCHSDERIAALVAAHHAERIGR